MLSPDNHLGIFAALMGLAALAFWLQTTRLGALLTGTVLVILMAIVAANVGLIPHQAPTYGFVFTYLVPVLIPLFLLQVGNPNTLSCLGGSPDGSPIAVSPAKIE